jgi:hypothetical protein
MRKLRKVAGEVLTRSGRNWKVADHVQVKEVWVGEAERRKRYVLCLNPEAAARQRRHRAQVLADLAAEIATLAEPETDHPKVAAKFDGKLW